MSAVELDMSASERIRRLTRALSEAEAYWREYPAIAASGVSLHHFMAAEAFRTLLAAVDKAAQS
jgi:hypothetical protein